MVLIYWLVWLEALKILWPLSWATKVFRVFASSNRQCCPVFLTPCFATFDTCPWILASSAAVFKNLPFFIFAKGPLHVPQELLGGGCVVQQGRMDRLACSFLQVGSFWTACKNGQDTYGIFLALTGLGALLIQPNKYFAAILNWIRLQWDVSPAQFTALVLLLQTDTSGYFYAVPSKYLTDTNREWGRYGRISNWSFAVLTEQERRGLRFSRNNRTVEVTKLFIIWLTKRF